MAPLPRNIRPGRGWETALAIIAALAAGGAGGYLIASRGGSSTATTAEKPAPRADRVTALGRLQPTNGVVPGYGPPGDRIAKLYSSVAPGKELRVGEPIADLASRRERLQEVVVAETQQQEAKTSLKYARAAGEQKVRAAEAELNQAKANKVSDLAALDAKQKYVEIQASAAAKQVDRLKKLRADGVKVADEDLEKAELLKAQADAELAAAKAMTEKTKTTYEETEKAAKAKIEAAKAELDEAVARAPVKSSDQKLTLARQMADL